MMIENLGDKNRDLTSKEINALVSMIIMLCGSTNIRGNINSEYIQKQLYTDKRDSVPEEALTFCSLLVNRLRKLSLKTDEEASVLKCYSMRHLRNVLVRFCDEKTKFKERRFCPVVDHPEAASVFVNHHTLYLIFCKDYNIFNEKNEPFTAYNDIRGDQEKTSLFKNFFNWSIVQRIIKERNLDPSFSFYYNSKHDLNFLGMKSKQALNTASTDNSNMAKSQAGDEIDAHERKRITDRIKEINDRVKAAKKTFTALRKQLNEKETERMDIGTMIRRREKEGKSWNAQEYQKLKKKREDCNAPYSQLQALNSSIKKDNSAMCFLNKQLNGQPVPQYTVPAKPSTIIADRLLQNSIWFRV